MFEYNVFPAGGASELKLDCGGVVVGAALPRSDGVSRNSIQVARRLNQELLICVRFLQKRFRSDVRTLYSVMISSIRKCLRVGGPLLRIIVCVHLNMSLKRSNLSGAWLVVSRLAC